MVSLCARCHAEHLCLCDITYPNHAEGALAGTEVIEGEQPASLLADAETNGMYAGADSGAELMNGRSDGAI
jgi:hypothetical protein